MPAVTVTTVTIANGATVSSTVAVPNGTLFGLWAPVLTACSLFIQGNVDQTSANFVRLGKSDGTGPWGWLVGTGSAAVTLQDIAFPFPYLRLESSAAQGAQRDFQLVVKMR